MTKILLDNGGSMLGLLPLKSVNESSEPIVPTIPTASWIQTYSGGRFWPLDPKPEHVRIEDIAHALANQCRFAGHVREFYSVAQHSVIVSLICDREDRLWGLLHDAPEAYSCDLPRPIKYDPRIMPVFKELERKLEAAIVQKFGLPEGEPASVKAADRRALFTERRDLLPHLEWNSDSWGMGLEGKPLPYCITPWTPQHAEKMFLKRYKELTNGRHNRNLERAWFEIREIYRSCAVHPEHQSGPAIVAELDQNAKRPEGRA